MSYGSKTGRSSSEVEKGVVRGRCEWVLGTASKQREAEATQVEGSQRAVTTTTERSDASLKMILAWLFAYSSDMIHTEEGRLIDFEERGREQPLVRKAGRSLRV